MENGKTSEKISVVIDLAPAFEESLNPFEETSKDLRNLLFEYLTDLLVDLRMPLELSLDLRLGEPSEKFSLNLYQIMINNQKQNALIF